MGQPGLRPEDLVITPRHLKFEFENSMSANRYWLNNDPVSTHFVNAFQATFPEGERFFIEAALDCKLRYEAARPMSERLKDDLDKFTRQEALHGLQHSKWTDELIRLGYDGMAVFGEEMKEFRILRRKRMSALFRLAITAAAEHYTASLATMFISNPAILTGSDLPFKAVLLYHSMEEVEHKSVCFDLFQLFSGNYLLRIAGFVYITDRLVRLIRSRMKYLLRKDGLWGKPGNGAFGFFFGRDGLVRRMLPGLMRYLKPSFHPWQTDERKTIEEKFGPLRESLGIPGFLRAENESR